MSTRLVQEKSYALTVVVENQTSSQNLLAEWGYSAWLQTEDAVILLDTGGIQHTLQHNLTALGLNARRITDLVLSHGHFDHTSGVMDVLRLAPHARVWAAPGIGRERLGDADAKRASGGGSMLAGLAFSPIDPFVEIAPGVTAFTVPATERDPRWVCTRHMFERTDSGEIVPDTFADDVSLLVQTEKARPCFWAARTPDFPIFCATPLVLSESIVSIPCSAARI